VIEETPSTQRGTAAAAGCVALPEEARGQPTAPEMTPGLLPPRTRLCGAIRHS
jgi:hypothetical protein